MSMTLVQVVIGGLLLGAVYALFSSGLTLIWGMMNVVNFAHGDFVMLGMYTAVVIWTALGGGPWASVPVAAALSPVEEMSVAPVDLSISFARET